MTSSLPSLLMTLIPLCLLGSIYVAGLVLAVIRWQLHPRAALMATIGLLMLLIGLGVTMITQAFVSTGGTMTSAEIGTIFQITGLIRTVLSVSGMTLLILAVFADRSNQRVREPDLFPTRLEQANRRNDPLNPPTSSSSAFRDRPPT